MGNLMPHQRDIRGSVMDIPTEGWTEGQMDGRTGRPSFRDAIMHLIIESPIVYIATFTAVIESPPSIAFIDFVNWMLIKLRMCRLWVSKHGLTGEAFRNLRAVVTYIICDFHYMWFEIKADSSLISGSRYKLKEIALISKMKGRDEKSKQVKEIAKKFVQKGAGTLTQSISFWRCFAVKRW